MLYICLSASATSRFSSSFRAEVHGSWLRFAGRVSHLSCWLPSSMLWCPHVGLSIAVVFHFSARDGHPIEKTGQRFMFHMGGVYLLTVLTTSLTFPQVGREAPRADISHDGLVCYVSPARHCAPRQQVSGGRRRRCQGRRGWVAK